MVDLIPGDAINCVYLTLVAIGLVWTIISLIGSDLETDVDVGGPDFDFHVGEFDVGGVHVPGVDLGLDAPDADVGGAIQLPSISSFTIASAITGFGAAGIIANLAFHASAAVSLLWAVGGALIMGGLMQVFYGAVLLKAQGTGQVRIGDLVGGQAEVIVPIEVGASGQIALVTGGRRVTYGARTAGEFSIPRGALVEIVRIVGGTAVVRQIGDR